MTAKWAFPQTGEPGPIARRVELTLQAEEGEFPCHMLKLQATVPRR